MILTQDMCREKASFARCVEVPIIRNSVLFAFSFNVLFFIQRDILETIPAGLGSDKFVMWSKKHRFVCHLHKDEDPGCDSG